MVTIVKGLQHQRSSLLTAQRVVARRRCVRGWGTAGGSSHERGLLVVRPPQWQDPAGFSSWELGGSENGGALSDLPSTRVPWGAATSSSEILSDWAGETDAERGTFDGDGAGEYPPV